jgi:conjugal transfer ATP-binding protein TraC
MKQSPEAIDSMEKNKYISASASEYERMKMIRTVKYVFSEIMIRFENVQQIVRLYVDRKWNFVLLQTRLTDVKYGTC